MSSPMIFRTNGSPSGSSPAIYDAAAFGVGSADFGQLHTGGAGVLAVVKTVSPELAHAVDISTAENGVADDEVVGWLPHDVEAAIADHFLAGISDLDLQEVVDRHLAARIG